MVAAVPTPEVAFVNYLVTDILAGFTPETIEQWKVPTGRKPAKLTLEIADIVKKMDAAEALTLTRWIVDSTLFHVCYGMSADCKSLRVRADLRFVSGCRETDGPALFHEIYRYAVEPGGVLFDAY